MSIKQQANEEVEVKEAQGVKEAEDKNGQTAAFFDLDGTLLPLPSLEQQLFRVLRCRGEIPLQNYFLWLREALKLLPSGIGAVEHANKMYLKGVPHLQESGAGNRSDSSAHKGGQQEEGQASAPPRHNPRWPVPHFFEQGVERVVRHAAQRHAIVIVSGTLEPLANAAAQALQGPLAALGFGIGIQVCATRLEESEGKWTGRILGEAMSGTAKARAIVTLARKRRLDLSQSWAYGDSAQDSWMLASVVNPVAVNPTPELARMAWKRTWPVLHWGERRALAERQEEDGDHQEDTREACKSEIVRKSPRLQQRRPNGEPCA
ncbi:MAG TPA: haloacid dehalogenase-like hydrolase [Candidatus Acidoferrum sp.]